MLTPEQLEERRKSIGSSDMAAIMESDPWRSPVDVWFDKLGMLEAEEPSDAMIAGSYMEVGVLDWCEDQLKSSENYMEINPDWGYLKRDHLEEVAGTHIVARVDAFCIDSSLQKHIPVEAKTSGLVSGFVPLEWGKPGSEEVPEHVYIQCHVHMIALGAPYCLVPVFLGNGRGFVMYRVFRDEDVVNGILEAAEEFWGYVERKEQPPGNGKMQYLKRVIREPDGVVQLRDETIVRFIDSNQDRLEAEKVEAEHKSKLITELGDAELGISDQYQVTFYANARGNRTLRVKEIVNE
jgi:predicted phage-related endonuclease